ncbi:hypothetical protein [uncultured Treponema sp.]|uniref:hypothetical protein n=1 Tax=uncultured Treponema sp. TaxID=162155 RepID=UPI0025FF8BE8|nr:hypothetical protein [uncultured Treponema sp.]
MNYKELLSKKNIIRILFSLLALAVFFILFHVFSHLGTNRRVFTYPVSGSDKYQKEIRYLNSHPVQGKIAFYVDELILGPSFYRGRALFTPGTHVEYCFLRENSLYVGLSKEAVLQENGAVGIKDACALFKSNIKMNFTGIKNIELFIDGNYIAD